MYVGWVTEWLPMRWPRSARSRTCAADRNPGIPMWPVVMKKWPRHPRRSSASAACSADAPPSSNVNAVWDPSPIRPTVTRVAAIASRWASNRSGSSL